MIARCYLSKPLQCTLVRVHEQDAMLHTIQISFFLTVWQLSALSERSAPSFH